MSCSLSRQSRTAGPSAFAQQADSRTNGRNLEEAGRYRKSGPAQLDTPVTSLSVKGERMQSSDRHATSNNISYRQGRGESQITTGTNKEDGTPSYQLHSRQGHCGNAKEKQSDDGNKLPSPRYTGSVDDSIRMINASYEGRINKLQCSRRDGNQQPQVGKRQVRSASLQNAWKSIGCGDGGKRRKSADMVEAKLRKRMDLRDLKRRKSADMMVVTVTNRKSLDVKKLKRRNSADMKDVSLPRHKGYLCYNCRQYGKASRSCTEPHCTADPKPPLRLDFKRKRSIDFDENDEYLSWQP